MVAGNALTPYSIAIIVLSSLSSIYIQYRAVRAAIGTPLNPFLFGFYITQPRPGARMQISGTTD